LICRWFGGEVVGSTINFAEGGFPIGFDGWSFGRRRVGRVQGHAASTPAEDGSEIEEFGQIGNFHATGVLSQLAGGSAGRLDHFFVKSPFLLAETLGAQFPIGDIVAEKLIESAAGKVGAVVVEGGGARFPIVARSQAAKTGNGRLESPGSFREEPRWHELQPGYEKLIVGRRFAGLAGPGSGG
jgi:hypothetical protein